MRYLLSIVFIFLGFATKAQNHSPKYEFRAVWVATVNNIDWPSKPGLSTAQQQKEIIDILNLHEDLGMNTIILQVRPTADAFYRSDLEPWSRYLTGIPGKAPIPFYDPLKFWIDECHKRGMELHAWLNPFRVSQNSNEPLAGNHIAFQHPEWILEYGEKLYFDPGLTETQEFVVKVVKDIVTRYDVDAIHFDDYFYPYPLAEEFPDTASFAKFNRGFLAKNKADWRRENVDIIINTLNDTIKATKPWVKFGISPFGVWRNKSEDPIGSDTKAGTTNYDQLYANILKWQEKGWIDYCIPQLYWQIGHSTVDFNLLANWWKNHAYGRAMYIGHAAYKSDAASTIKEWTLPDELPKQIDLIRNIHEIGGSAFYSSNHFLCDLVGFQDSLKYNYYKTPALVPPMPWLDSIPPQPVFKFKKRGKKIKWEVLPTDDEMNKSVRFLIYFNESATPLNVDNPESFIIVLAKDEYKYERINRKKKKYEVRISVLDRFNNESVMSAPLLLKL